jgi:hypothetical protein
MLEVVYDEQIMSQSRAFERHHTFMDGHGFLEHVLCNAWQSVSWSKDTVGQIKEVVHCDYIQMVKRLQKRSEPS